MCPKKNCMQWLYNALPIPEAVLNYQKKPAHLLCKVFDQQSLPTNFFPKKNTFSSMKKAVVQLLS